MVERLGPDHLPQRERDPERLQILAKRDQLFASRRFVIAVDARGLARIERPRGCHVGRDHIVLDQPVRIEPFTHPDIRDPAAFVEHHAPLGQIQIERGARRARLRQRSPRRPHRGQNGMVVAPARVDARLRVLIGDIGHAPDRRTLEMVPRQGAVRPDPQMAGEHRARLSLDQAARVCRQGMRQHRHHAVGEVDAVAAQPRLAVERRVRAHEPAYVRDRHDRAPVAGLVRDPPPPRPRRRDRARPPGRSSGRANASDRCAAPAAARQRSRPPPAPRRGTHAGCAWRGWRSD